MRWLKHPAIRLVVELAALVAVFVVVGVVFAPLPEWARTALHVVLAVAVYVALVRGLERRPVTELGPERAAREVGLGLLLGAGLFVATLGAIAAGGGYTVAGTRAPWVLLAPVPLALSSGIVEELVVRGVVFRNLEAWLGRWAALAISALGFGLLHLGNPHATWWAALAIALEAGVLLAVAYLTTRRLWFPIALHVAWNWTQAVCGVAVSGIRVRGWLIGELHGPAWLTGGDFGPEASAVAVAICAMASALLLRRSIVSGRRRRPG